MGAFGKLLIQYWGGDMDVYNGNSKPTPPPKVKKITKKQQREDDLEVDKHFFDMVSYSSESVIEKAMNMLDQISKDEVVFEFKTEQYQKKFIKWRTEFITKLNK